MGAVPVVGAGCLRTGDGGPVFAGFVDWELSSAVVCSRVTWIVGLIGVCGVPVALSESAMLLYMVGKKKGVELLECWELPVLCVSYSLVGYYPCV